MLHAPEPDRREPTSPPSFCIVMPFHIVEGRGGGAEVQAWYLARELARRGYRVGYIAQSVQGKQGTVESMDGVSIHWVRNAHRFRWSNSLAYHRALSKVDADIVIQRMTAFTTGVAAFWCRRHGRRFVWICSDDGAPRKWVFLRNQRAANRSAQVGWIKGTILMVDALITDLGRNWGMNHVWIAFTQNNAQEKLLEQEFGLNSKRMISGHPSPPYVVPINEKLRRPVALWAAHLGAKKRPEKFIELAKLARSGVLEFVMIGGHFDPSRVTSLMANLPKNLKWLGKLKFDEALAMFDKAAFFVNTSLLEGEGFPNTFIQAWLRGVPVVSLQVDPDGTISKNGLGVVDPDPAALLRFMEWSVSDHISYKAIAERARNYAEQNLSIKRMCDNFLSYLLLDDFTK